MGATLVVARGPSWFVFRTSAGPPTELATGEGRGALRADAACARALRAAVGSEEVVAYPARAANTLAAALGRAVAVATIAEVGGALGRIPALPAEEERRFLLRLASGALNEVVRSPEEIVVSLAREEARFERAVEREARAAETFVTPPGTPLELQAREWQTLRDRLGEHHRRLRARLEDVTTAYAPNLAAVVGPRVAGRLVAAAGGLGTLARISASRLQLLGARRRPSPDRGPRYGVLFTAECLADVPERRRPAFARSVAALAVIAARADAGSRADLTRFLLERRDRRAERLRRSGR